MTSSLVSSFLGALQASWSVLLVILYGVLAAEFKLLDGPSIKKISTICVQFFLPALLITNIGREWNLNSSGKYVPILIWAVIYNVVSLAIGWAGVRLFQFPRWITAAVAFNNTTSLPLLLIRSLEATGILSRLLVKGDTIQEAISRAQSYFLVSSIIGNCLTFAVGPRLIRTASVNTPDLENHKVVAQRSEETAPPASEDDHEGAPLLPTSSQDTAKDATSLTSSESQQSSVKDYRKEALSILYDFINAPTIGACIGVFIGIIPHLHRAFFNDPFDGGIFTAWLTISLQNIGQLFVSLQVIVVGVTLSNSFQRPNPPPSSSNNKPQSQWLWRPALFVLLFRFVIWPLLSIPLIYILATKSKILDGDPVLWFVMMLMPTGPPAMKLIAMAEVSGADEEGKMAVARVQAIAYVVSPVMSFAIVGALRASRVAMEAARLG
jgi:auxin efflux carrier family protein